jgi:hypothetical protein
MPIDVYVDGRRWRVKESELAMAAARRLRDNFGSLDMIFGFEILDESGNEGVIRLDPTKLTSFAIFEVPD